MKSTTARFASLAMVLLFVLAGVSQAMGNISCSMPCCREKEDPCHASKEKAREKNGCCGDVNISLAPGSGCGPERKGDIGFSTVSHSPTPLPHGLEVSVVHVPPIPSPSPLSTVPTASPPGKGPLYLQNAILLI